MKEKGRERERERGKESGREGIERERERKDVLYIHMLQNTYCMYMHVYPPIICTILFELYLNKLAKPTAVVISQSSCITKRLYEEKSNVTFLYLTTSEMRTPHYSEHFNMAQ